MRIAVILVGLVVVSVLAAASAMPLALWAVPAARDSETIGLGLMAGIGLMVFAVGALLAPWRRRAG